MTRIEINEDCIVFSHSSRARARCEAVIRRIASMRESGHSSRTRARCEVMGDYQREKIRMSLLAHAREMRELASQR